MEYELTFKLILLVILIVLSAFFSGSEASIFFLTPLHLHKMKEERIPFTASVLKLLGRPRRLLVTILTGNESVNIAIAALMTSVSIYFFGTEGKWIAIAVASITLIIFGDAIPKNFAIVHPMRVSSAVALPLVFLIWLLRPVVWFLEKISDLFILLFSKDRRTEDEALTEDTFKALVDAGHQEGALEESQKDLIHKVFKLADTRVSDIMIPRVDMFCLPVSMNIREIERDIIRERVARIPIYGTDRDNILGLLHAKHLLAEVAKGQKRGGWQHLITKPYFVPMEKRADQMLRDFQRRSLQMAIVVDEYGGVAGLVTLYDILRNLFFDIYEKNGDTREMFRRISEDTLIVSSMMDIEDFSKLVDIPIATEEFDTAGGFVFHLFGKLPAEGEAISVGSYTFTVETIDKARILSVRITKREGPQDD
ncbi:MAG: hemolysin family protein [Syntrophales bacterium]|nr:hemolysin family protein [Syntrophales bacterium]